MFYAICVCLPNNGSLSCHQVFLDLWNEGVAVTYIKCMSLWSEVAILVIVLGMP